MSRESALALIASYYARFNAKDVDGFLALLDAHVIHDINQGGREHGRHAFAAFLTRMNLCYDEQIVDLVVMANEAGDRAGAEFTVLGKYLQADDGLPAAHGQAYRLAAGAFFEIADGKITRVTNYYNLQNWLQQVED